MSVDTARHVITHIKADHADKKDSHSLQTLTLALQKRLRKHHLLWRNLAADTGYSNGENYAFLERIGIESYIPPHGTYKGGPAGFEYQKEGDYWLCCHPHCNAIPHVFLGSVGIRFFPFFHPTALSHSACHPACVRPQCMRAWSAQPQKRCPNRPAQMRGPP
jgi:hypothetical protein